MRNIDKKNEPFEYKFDRVIPSQELGLSTFWWLANDVHGIPLIIEENWGFADQQSGDKLLDLIRADGVGRVLA
jgi:hypothetical protein